MMADAIHNIVAVVNHYLRIHYIVSSHCQNTVGIMFKHYVFPFDRSTAEPRPLCADVMTSGYRMDLDYREICGNRVQGRELGYKLSVYILFF